MEAHVIVHSVFWFTLLFVCVLHALCVCLEGHSGSCIFFFRCGLFFLEVIFFLS